jgi:hypothetical protein
LHDFVQDAQKQLAQTPHLPQKFSEEDQVLVNDQVPPETPTDQEVSQNLPVREAVGAAVCGNQGKSTNGTNAEQSMHDERCPSECSEAHEAGQCTDQSICASNGGPMSPVNVSCPAGAPQAKADLEINSRNACILDDALAATPYSAQVCHSKLGLESTSTLFCIKVCKQLSDGLILCQPCVEVC